MDKESLSKEMFEEHDIFDAKDYENVQESFENGDARQAFRYLETRLYKDLDSDGHFDWDTIKNAHLENDPLFREIHELAVEETEPEYGRDVRIRTSLGLGVMGGFGGYHMPEHMQSQEFSSYVSEAGTYLADYPEALIPAAAGALAVGYLSDKGLRTVSHLKTAAKFRNEEDLLER